ncbi:MAG: hypothetical protein WC979_02520 [Candidatus Pacearchaeota archaeon]|jgi:hypothetical protein|nr:hypothetical protein [Clostridia bacterium]
MKTKVNFRIDLQYSIPNALVLTRKQDYIKNDASKRLLNGSLWTCFEMSFKPNSKDNFMDLSNEISNTFCSDKFQKLQWLISEFQRWMIAIDDCKNLAPSHLNDPTINADSLIHSKGTWECHKINIINNPSAIEKNEELMLAKIDEFVKEGLEEYITIRPSFECWSYYHGDIDCDNMKPSEFVAHRREMLKLRN